MMLVEIIWILKDMEAGQPCMQGERQETQMEDENPQAPVGMQITRTQAQAAVKKKLTKSGALRRGVWLSSWINRICCNIDILTT